MNPRLVFFLVAGGLAVVIVLLLRLVEILDECDEARRAVQRWKTIQRLTENGFYRLQEHDPHRRLRVVRKGRNDNGTG